MQLERHGELRPEDQEAALALMKENPILDGDPYARRVVETGLADNGKPVDVGDFLSVRLAVLQKALAEGRLERFDREMVELAYSVSPKIEKWLN